MTGWISYLVAVIFGGIGGGIVTLAILGAMKIIEKLRELKKGQA